MRILVVEDDALLARSLNKSLAPLGHQVESFTTYQAAHAAMERAEFDLILLDLGLPDGDGLGLLSWLRDRGNATPVLIITARDAIDDRVRGLDEGADDYLAKPFSLAELEARVRALLRRSQQRTSNRLSLGPLSFDAQSGAVYLDATPLDLPHRERCLIEGLLQHGERIAPRELLENRVFGFAEVGSNALEVYVSRLRKRLEGSGLRVRTFRGLGYRLEMDTP
ncbi:MULTISPECIES: response regulator [Modicisalibacter]|uniref:response regulator n=1 Tax=Modicisalibacter TaxID=574347 RepID=UPI00100AA1CF|nr:MULTISPECIES: response regulator [Halomonadaceae]MBZ9560094.1 response regulator [Modicisalibacter sp. R2A 31.J]MBZ9576002.1 response regulator [Modicisalibacter sp. MOD 31.J]